MCAVDLPHDERMFAEPAVSVQAPRPLLEPPNGQGYSPLMCRVCWSSRHVAIWRNGDTTTGLCAEASSAPLVATGTRELGEGVEDS